MQWCAPEEWQKIQREEHCPACHELKRGAPPEGFVADLRVSQLVLQPNQYVRGYCQLMSLVHATELHKLPEQVQQQFLADLSDVSAALERVFQPAKLNINFLGNIVPHVHGHILPRYLNDHAPHRPIDPQAQQVFLDQAAFDKRVRKIREALLR